MAAFETLDDLLASVGRELGTTRWHTITRADVQGFADATNAHEWIHLDTARARTESPYGTTVAHGYLTLSLATPFLTELLDVRGTLGINYGLDRVRFPAPVPVGRRVRARGRLKVAESSEAGVRTVIELVYQTEGADKPPCVAEVVSLIVPASGGGAPAARG